MTTLVISTQNTHKIREIRAILPDRFQFYSLKEFPGAPAIVEDANTFAGNAAKKAVGLARWIAERPGGEIPRAGDDWFVLADDSGLEVDALNGAPGVHSARFAALDADASAASGNSPDAANNAKLLRLLKQTPAPARTARFRCVLALTPVLPPSSESSSPVCQADAFELQTVLFDGACEGHIALAPSGQGGFGYDPLFVPTGYSATFAELGEEVKNQLSHRAKALQKLREHWGME